MNCQGNGQCFKLYVCECGCIDDCDCFDECECEIIHTNTCLYIDNPEHKECIIFCKFKPECELKCSLIECGNYFICSSKMPSYILEKNNNLCDTCYLQLGNLKKDGIKECFICFNVKENIILSCGHSTCFECFEKWTFVNEDRPCPICRSMN